MTPAAQKLRAENNLKALPESDQNSVRMIVNTSVHDAKITIDSLIRTKDARTVKILEVSFDYEKTNSNRSSIIKLITSGLRKAKPAEEVEVVTDDTLDPEWEEIRKTSSDLGTGFRLTLRLQVRLGMLLSEKKKAYGATGAGRRINLADSAKLIPWAEKVEKETGYSRRQCDEFIRYAEAVRMKLSKTKKLELPGVSKKDALALFAPGTALQLTPEQWEIADAVIGSQTTGETQVSLMQHLNIVPKPKPMPHGNNDNSSSSKISAGQQAILFFEPVVSRLINARCSSDYKKYLASLPEQSDEESTVSLATLESEARAIIADIEEAKKGSLKTAKGKTVR